MLTHASHCVPALFLGSEDVGVPREGHAHPHGHHIYIYIYIYIIYIYIQTRIQGGGKGGNTPPWGSQGGVIPPPELQPQMETAHFPRH